MHFSNCMPKARDGNRWTGKSKGQGSWLTSARKRRSSIVGTTVSRNNLNKCIQMVFTILRFLEHTQWHTTLSTTPLDEGSARRRNLYLTTHNTHNRRTSAHTSDAPVTTHLHGKRKEEFSLLLGNLLCNQTRVRLVHLFVRCFQEVSDEHGICVASFPSTLKYFNFLAQVALLLLQKSSPSHIFIHEQLLRYILYSPLQFLTDLNVDIKLHRKVLIKFTLHFAG